MGFNFSLADTSYYSYILVYIDNTLTVSRDPVRYMDQLKSSYCVNPESIGISKMYLGSEAKQVSDRSGNPSWAIINNKNIKESWSITDQHMTEMNSCTTTEN